MTRRRRLLAAVLTLLIAAHGTGTQAQSAAEYAIKAAFVFNVASFVEWPPAAFPNARSPITVTLVSAHPMPEFVKALSAKTVRGRAITVDQVEHADQVHPTHVVFIAAESLAELRATLKTVGREPVLTIVEQSLDAPSDAVVTVGVAQTRLAFAVNLDSADAAGLKISPNLLKLAKQVRSSRAQTK